MKGMQDNRTSFRQFADRYRPMIEQTLDELTRRTVTEPEALNAAVRYSLLSGGKRIRPLLALLAAKACGADPTVALSSGCVVEMVHAFSLIHDDLPCMDDDDLRRGKPTNHIVHGEAMALLAGDSLLARASTVLTDTESCVALARATEEMIEGQVLDMTAEKRASVDQEFLDELNASKERREALIEFGRLCGLAFQITDDLLDLLGDENAAGKRLGKDAEKGKRTYPAVIGIDASRTRVLALIAQACDLLKPFGDSAQELRGFAESLPDRLF
jgi:geranylgeranyl diphosphate synthase, type II